MNSDPWGGSEEHWFSFAQFCCKKDIEVTCLVYDWEEKKQKLNSLVNLGVKLVYIPNRGRKKKNFFEKIRYEWFTRIQQRIFVANFNFSKYDYVLVNQGGFMEVANSPWKNLYKKLNKYSLTFHNYDLNYFFKPNKAVVLCEWINNAHLSFFASIFSTSIIEKQLKTKIKNCNVLFNPLTINFSSSYSKFPNLIDGKYRIVMLAHLDVSRKAQDNLIKALATDVWKNRNVLFQLFGKGRDFDYLQNLIYENELHNIVEMKGNSNNVSEVLNKSHLVLQITHKDAMPISVIEAMSKSRAVVVSNIGDMPFWIENGKNGWVANDASKSEIKDVLEIAWSNKEKWEEMGKCSYEIFKKKFPLNTNDYFYELIKIKPHN